MIGRPPLSPEERATRSVIARGKIIKKRKNLEAVRRENGLCRACGEKLAITSKVFCQRHLQQHRISCSRNQQSKFSRLKSQAKVRNIPMFFNECYFDKWLNDQPDVCHYCGVHVKELKDSKDKKKRNLTIDRKDNSVGYSLENICLACFRCNNMKSDFFGYDEWVKIAAQYIKPRLAEYHHFA
jgi:hypothetical protein